MAHGGDQMPERNPSVPKDNLDGQSKGPEVKSIMSECERQYREDNKRYSGSSGSGGKKGPSYTK
jgi:hypothetical protein